MPLREKEPRTLFLMRKIVNKINSETKVYEAYLYKDNSIKISEFDGDVYCASDTLKRKAQVFSDSNGDAGLTAIGDTEEEAAHY